ncbi:hypothetical protein LTR70_002653 [Exophiala xenobiotica]|uniref:F-box domain-containing protein n=1 Tax=Lithohypha guttulata TaxID=1690604 RepID=A0ABR0K1X3_9EURO|nr:hypothetical protein LTR24_008425 [Lithohypha guttulata]KAK5325272.1 hypothetical protein LTR70_002653 [Exophiala xenobiotica]
MAATSTEPKGIHKIPNELLVKILAFVPFVPPTPSYLGKPGAFGSHDRLRRVDDRFRDVVHSAALRLQTVRCQLPELAALRGLTAVSPTELVDFSLLDSDVRLATEKVTKKDGGMSAKHVIFTSLHLLSYMSSVVDDKGHDLPNACLFTWAKKDLFSSRWLQILRYALHCVFDHLFPTIKHFGLMLDEALTGVMIRVQNEIQMVDIPRMLKRRSFEAAVLFRNHAGSLHAKIIRQDGPLGLVNYADALYGHLCSILLRRCAATTRIASELADESFEDDLDFVQNMLWCASSRAFRVSQIIRSYIREASNDDHLHRKYEVSNVSGGPSISIKEMEDAGAFLRKAHSVIVTKGVPHHLKRCAKARGLSFIMNRLDGNDESESDDDGEEEDTEGTEDTEEEDDEEDEGEDEDEDEDEEDADGTDEDTGSNSEDEAESNTADNEDGMGEDR